MLVDLFVGDSGHLGVLFGAGQLGGVLVGLFDEFLDACAHGVVIEEFMVAFFNAYVLGGLESVVRDWECWCGCVMKGRYDCTYIR